MFQENAKIAVCSYVAWPIGSSRVDVTRLSQLAWRSRPAGGGGGGGRGGVGGGHGQEKRERESMVARVGGGNWGS